LTERSPVVATVGTGRALKNAENGDGDVVLVHSKLDEEKFGPDYLKFITDDDWPL